MTIHGSCSWERWLNPLGITLADLQRHENCFVPQKTKYRQKITWYESWLPATDEDGNLSNLTLSDVLDHLTGHRRIAILSPPSINYFCIPIASLSESDRKQHIKILIENFGTPIVCIPLRGKCWNCVFFLRRSVDSGKLATTLGICLEELFGGLVRKLEFFPAKGAKFELPFGKGSMVLDPSTLKPSSLTLKDKIAYAVKLQQETRLLDADSLIEAVEGFAGTPIDIPASN